MEELCLTMYFRITLVLTFMHVVSCQETLFGVVSLSLSPFTSVSLNQDEGYVNVSLLLYDSLTNAPSINSTAFIDEDVTVMCSIITPYENGDSIVVFVEDVIPSFAESGSIDFSIEEQGRTVEIQCRGETSPDSTGTTSYFSYDTSAGPTGFLVVKKSPVVSFCEEIVLVPISSGITSSTVQVELSEPVVDYPVTISCNIIGVIDANNSLWLDFQDTTVQPGGRTDITISYDISRLGDIVQVACYGISAQGSQYLRNTSQGELAIFQMETSSVTLIPSVSSIKDRSISVFLVLGSVLTPGEGTITYACYVDPVTSYEQGLELAANPTCKTPDDVFKRPTPGPDVTTVTAAPEATTDNTTDPMTTPTTPPVQTTPTTPVPTTTTQAPTPPTSTTNTPTPAPSLSNETWRLVESEIAFEEGEIFKTLTLNLDSDTPTFDGAILVSCCAPQDINSNTKYINTSTALTFYAKVQAPRDINWTLATDFANRFMESSLPNPAYVDLSPCPCDLTSGHCDADCCCDEDCDAADTLVFTCADDTEEYPVTIYDCNSTDLYKADFSPLLCVQTSNTPYLGMYQSTVSAVRDIASFNLARATSLTSRDTSYQDSGLRSLEYQSPDNSQYSNGDPVELLYDEETRGFLALPQMTLSGECLWTSPVKFQEDLTTRCTLMPDQRLCHEFSPFSAMMFLRSSTESYPPCPKEPKVASQYGQATEATADVEYYCLEDVSDYLSEEVTEEDLFGLYDSSLFAEYQNDTSEEKIPKRCSWDDGYTQPPIPMYDNETRLCSDSVVSASYEMFWRGGEIIRIRGVIILGAVPLIQDFSIAIEESEEFVPPPPTTEAPLITEPTTEPLLTDSLSSLTLITDITEIFETVITDLAMSTDNVTMFMFGEDVNATTAQQSTVTTPGTTLQGTTSSTTQAVLTPPTTPSVTTSGSVTSPGVTTDATTNATTNATSSMSNGTMGIDNINVTTEAPLTTASPFSPVNARPLNITLRFSTTFTYLPETVVDPVTGQNIDPPEAFERSGNPGYIIGKPLLTGVVMLTPLVLPTDPGPPVNCTEFPTSPSCIEIPENETVYVFDSVDTSPASQLQIFSPGDGSLCARSSTSTLTFGEDSVSGCILRMGQSELQNCSILAAYMEEQLRALVPADRIGKRGNSSVLVEEDWAEIFNPDDHPFDPPTTMPPTTEAFTGTTADPFTTRFPGQRYIDPEAPIQAVEQLRSRCSGVPTSMNLEVLIAEAGVYNGVTQYEVLAARVQYSTSTVTLTCSGSLGASCYLEDRPVVADPAGNGTIVQSFPVYSTVTYTTVPVVEPEPVILYYKDYDPNLCKQDTCLSELFYPITGGFDGDTYQYSVAISLVLVIITTAYFIVTRPWAHL